MLRAQCHLIADCYNCSTLWRLLVDATYDEELRWGALDGK